VDNCVAPFTSHGKLHEFSAEKLICWARLAHFDLFAINFTVYFLEVDKCDAPFTSHGKLHEFGAEKPICWAKLAHFDLFAINCTVWSHILSTIRVALSGVCFIKERRVSFLYVRKCTIFSLLRCSTLMFRIWNGEAVSAVCFVWWLFYYTTILRKRRLASCSSCALRTSGSFYLSFLSQLIFFFCIIWIGMQEVGEEKEYRGCAGCFCWDCCFGFFFHRRPLECLAWFALEQEEWTLMFFFRVHADVILMIYVFRV